MQKRSMVGAALVAMLLAGCGNHEPKDPATQPVGAHPVATTSGPVTSAGSSSVPSTTALDPAKAAFGRLQDFVGSTKGMDGTVDYVENDGTDGTLHLAGSFGFDADLAAPAGELQLQAILATPVPIAIRYISNRVYFRQRTDPWIALNYGPSTTPAQSSDLQVAAMLLSDITPSTWSALANGDSGLKATSSAAGRTTLTGAVSTFGAAHELESYPGLGSLNAVKQWPKDVTYSVTTDQQGRIVAATEKWTGANTSASVAIKVTGYVAPTVTTPTVNVAN